MGTAHKWNSNQAIFSFALLPRGRFPGWSMPFNGFGPRMISRDSTHSGIVVNHAGDTFEATTKGIAEGSLWTYSGKPVLIARHTDMDLALFQYAFDKTQRRRGEAYPVYRLLFHIFPPLSKYLGGGMTVCSELVAEFLYFADLLEYWMGVNPDELEEIFWNWKGFDIVFEGILPEKETS
jgi:hypothetical protein